MISNCLQAYTLDVIGTTLDLPKDYLVMPRVKGSTLVIPTVYLKCLNNRCLMTCHHDPTVILHMEVMQAKTICSTNISKVQYSTSSLLPIAHILKHYIFVAENKNISLSTFVG
jgi:hypothetical protein